MDELFEIPVIFKGKELLFNGKLLAYSYSYKIAVEVEGVLFLFEPDNEKNFRAVADPEKIKMAGKIDVELLKSIATSLQHILS